MTKVFVKRTIILFLQCNKHFFFAGGISVGEEHSYVQLVSTESFL